MVIISHLCSLTLNLEETMLSVEWLTGRQRTRGKSHSRSTSESLTVLSQFLRFIPLEYPPLIDRLCRFMWHVYYFASPESSQRNPQCCCQSNCVTIITQGIVSAAESIICCSFVNTTESESVFGIKDDGPDESLCHRVQRVAPVIYQEATGTRRDNENDLVHDAN